MITHPFPDNHNLKHYSIEEIEILAQAGAEVFDAVEMKEIKDMFLFDMQNIIIKHDLIDQHFADKQSVSFCFLVLKDMFDRIEKAGEMMRSRKSDAK